MAEPLEVGGPPSSPSPRVTPVPWAEMSERTHEQLSRANLDRDEEPLAVFGTLARHPKLLAAWLPFCRTPADRGDPGSTLHRTGHPAGRLQYGQRLRVGPARGYLCRSGDRARGHGARP